MVHSPPETALLESSAPRTSGPFLSYEFIDSQDPNTKSQIQRHTAHHAVQQRREAARKRLLREGSTPRLLAWQRRLSSETTSSSISFSNSTNSLPTFPPTEPSIVTPTDETVMNHNPTSSPSEQQAPAIMPYTDSEEALLQYYASTRCKRRSHAAYFSRLLTRVRGEPSAAYLIMAYAAAHRAASGTSNYSRDMGLAADYKTKCFTLVSARLRTANGIHKASEQNIQAVLFLLAYETRYGTPQEAITHLNGLRGMIRERGGLHAFEDQVTLRHQLLWVELTGTAATVLGCAPNCKEDSDISTVPQAAVQTWSRISLTEPSGDLSQSFIHWLRIFQSREHVGVLRGVFAPAARTYQIASAALENPNSDNPASFWGHLMAECRLACLFYINALILTSYNSIQRARDVVYDTVILHFGIDYPTSESPLGLLWVFLYSLQLSDYRNKETLRVVIKMMQAARRLQKERQHMVEYILVQLLFYPNRAAEAGLSLNENDIVNDIMRH